MSRYLVAVWPLYGHLFPNIAIANTLRDQGHEVAFYTGASVEQHLDEAGFTLFPFHEVKGELWERSLAQGYMQGPVWQQWRNQRRLLQEWLIGTVPGQIADLTSVIARWKPDLIICDPTMWAPFLVLHECLNIPVALYSWTVGCMLPGPDAPPIGPGLPLARTRKARVTQNAVRAIMNRLSSGIRRTANEIRSDYGLPPLTGAIAAHAGRLPLYLVTSSPDLDYERGDLPPSVHYVGPCQWSSPVESSEQQWIDELTLEGPCVYVTEGTLHHQNPIVLQAAAAGLADLPLLVIMTTGRHWRPHELKLHPVAENIRLEEWAPDQLLIPRVSVLITNGGAGSVLRALQAGVPLVVVPTEWDKPENAQRVVESGAGIRLSPNECTPERLREAVLLVLNEPQFRDNARRIAHSFQRYGGVSHAAELLEVCAAKQRKAAPS